MDKEQKKEDERVPAPTVSGEKRCKKQKFWLIFGGITLLIIFFFIGMGTLWFSLDEGMRKLIWVKDRIDKEYYQEIDDDLFYGAIFDAVNNDVLDEYSCYMSADKYKDSTSQAQGKRIGLGIVFYITTEEGKAQLNVARVYGNSPAEEAGIASGEKVLGFGKTQQDIQQISVYDEFSAFLNTCGEGELFYLQVQGRDGQTRMVQMAQKSYTQSYVFYRTNQKSYTFTGASASVMIERGEPLSCLPDDTAYLRLLQFAGNAVTGVQQALQLFQQEGKKHLVLDLRENGGGYVETMQEIAGYFCKNTQAKKPLVAIADYGEKQEKFYADKNAYGQYFGEDSKIYVLADGWTASAAESLLGAMLDYQTTSYNDICLIEEEGVAKTYGKGIMQTTYYLDYFEKDAVKLTTATICWPITKNCIHGRGVLSSDGTKSVQNNHIDEEEIYAAISALLS